MTDQWKPVDLSPLDPERRPEQWAARMEATRQAVAAVLQERMREVGPLDVLSGWARPIIAAAAVLLVVLGGAGTMLDRPAAPEVTEVRRLALLSESAVARGRVPTGAELRATLQGKAR